MFLRIPFVGVFVRIFDDVAIDSLVIHKLVFIQSSTWELARSLITLIAVSKTTPDLT